MESIKVAIQLHWFLWPPRYVKLVCPCDMVCTCYSCCSETRLGLNCTNNLKHALSCQITLFHQNRIHSGEEGLSTGLYNFAVCTLIIGEDSH